ncbi:hypothetical protein FQR65_LT12635 [Abscondita terminalis]|nr:hypothetical protein FQR65_LT12635 [Abscondita terminalis]
MLEHFCHSNIMALCTTPNNVANVIDKLTHEDLLNLQKLIDRESSGTEHFKKTLADEIQNYHAYLNAFHLFLKCLHILVHDLPGVPLGNQVRELYYSAISKGIFLTSEYVEAFKLLSFRSKEEFVDKIAKVINQLDDHLSNSKFNKNEVEEILIQLQDHLKLIEVATDEMIEVNKINNDKAEQMLSNTTDRKQLRKKLMELSLSSKPKNKYEIARDNLIKYMETLFRKYLKEPKSTSLYKIFFFDNLSIEQLVLGSHSSAIHAALNDPHCYFECDCCKLTSDTNILSTHPDIGILYKLHLEYGKLINLFDWLQSFVSIVNPQDSDEDEMKITPELQYPL